MYAKGELQGAKNVSLCAKMFFEGVVTVKFKNVMNKAQNPA